MITLKIHTFLLNLPSFWVIILKIHTFLLNLPYSNLLGDYTQNPHFSSESSLFKPSGGLHSKSTLFFWIFLIQTFWVITLKIHTFLLNLPYSNLLGDYTQNTHFSSQSSLFKPSGWLHSKSTLFFWIFLIQNFGVITLKIHTFILNLPCLKPLGHCTQNPHFSKSYFFSSESYLFKPSGSLYSKSTPFFWIFLKQTHWWFDITANVTNQSHSKNVLL